MNARYIPPTAPYDGQIPATASPLAPRPSPLRARLAENLAIGLGLGILVAVPAAWLSLSVALLAGLCICLLAFAARTAGLVSGARLAVALLRAHAHIAELQRDIDALLAELDQADALHASALRDMHMAQAEAAQLRSRLQPTYRPAASLYAPVRADARRLVEMYEERGGQWTGRDQLMAQLGWSKSRYEAAFDLLRDSGVIAVNHRTVSVRLRLADAVAAIDRHSHNLGAPDPLAEAADPSPLGSD